MKATQNYSQESINYRNVYNWIKNNFRISYPTKRQFYLVVILIMNIDVVSFRKFNNFRQDAILYGLLRPELVQWDTQIGDRIV